LLAQRGAPLPLARLALKQELVSEYGGLLPAVTPEEWRRIRGEQDIIVRYEPERAIASLPSLLRDPGDRERLITLARRLFADERVQRAKPSSEQIAMLENIGERLDVAPRRRAPKKARAKPRKAAAKTTRKGAGRPPAKRPRRTRLEARQDGARTHEIPDLLDVCKALPPTPTAVAHPATRARSRAPSMRRGWG
jgi:hypothetical protein